MHPGNTQCTQPVRSDSLICPHGEARKSWFLHAHNKDLNHTGRMPKLICVFGRCEYHFVGSTCTLSYTRYWSIINIIVFAWVDVLNPRKQLIVMSGTKLTLILANMIWQSHEMLVLIT